MMQYVQMQCSHAYHGSDFLYYCLYRDCNQYNRYICKNCVQNRSHEHYDYHHGNLGSDLFQHIIEIQNLEQQLKFDTNWIIGNFYEFNMILIDLEKIKNILFTQTQFKLLLKTQKLQKSLINLANKFNKPINLIYLDEQGLNELIQEIYLHSEYREACNLLANINDDKYLIPYFSDNHKSPKQYIDVFTTMEAIKQKLQFLGSRKFDQNKYLYQHVELNIRQLKTSDYVQISQNEQFIVHQQDSYLNLITIGVPILQQYNCKSEIKYVEFIENSNSLYVYLKSYFRLLNFKTMKSKFSIFSAGNHIQRDKYSILVRNRKKIKCYNKQSRKQIWKYDINNFFIFYQSKNQLIDQILLVDYDDYIQIINIQTKKKIFMDVPFGPEVVKQIKLLDNFFYVFQEQNECHAKFYKFKINDEQNSSNQLQTYPFRMLKYFRLDNDQNTLMYFPDRISIYDKNFILCHQIGFIIGFQIYFSTKQLEIRQQSKNLIVFANKQYKNQKSVNEMYYFKKVN